MKETVLNKFLRYVAIDTRSDENSNTQPSTMKQLNLSKLLVKELKEMGIKDAALDEHGYVMATIPSNINKKTPVIGFIAHVDTAPDLSGADIKPQIIENYNGKDIVLNKEKKLSLLLNDFPELSDFKGKTLITTDGTTLLGADDKAGIAEIMTAAEFIMNHPELKHGTIKIGFTPDEEIGRGVDKFDVKKFGADYAYTMDGGALGELEYENFNAASAKIKIQGNNIHPGYAKGKMINSILVAMELNALLPISERPEFTCNYEGFFHITHFSGNVEQASMQYIIRDHDRKKFEQKKETVKSCVDFLNKRYGKDILTLELKDQYYNMREMVEPHYHVVETAVKAMQLANVEPVIRPIRGGTDGARLSFMGLPCPNIFAGGHNFHGKYEFVAVESMQKATEVILSIIKLYAEKQ
ncbi:MAG: peptidase T [Prevotellaceae bacterium]|jgi:tripeptide aminopeptidase|nr:peptidase T [Prevotellaceae bacterium]